MNLFIKDNVVQSSETIVLTTSIKGEDYTVLNPTEEMLLEAGWEKYTVPKEEIYKNMVIELIRERYSVDDEIAILRQHTTKPEEFELYNTYVEECKTKAREEVYGESAS